MSIKDYKKQDGRTWLLKEPKKFFRKDQNFDQTFVALTKVQNRVFDLIITGPDNGYDGLDKCFKKGTTAKDFTSCVKIVREFMESPAVRNFLDTQKNEINIERGNVNNYWILSKDAAEAKTPDKVEEYKNDAEKMYLDLKKSFNFLNDGKTKEKFLSFDDGRHAYYKLERCRNDIEKFEKYIVKEWKGTDQIRKR